MKPCPQCGHDLVTSAYFGGIVCPDCHWTPASELHGLSGEDESPRTWRDEYLAFPRTYEVEFIPEGDPMTHLSLKYVEDRLHALAERLTASPHGTNAADSKSIADELHRHGNFLSGFTPEGQPIEQAQDRETQTTTPSTDTPPVPPPAPPDSETADVSDDGPDEPGDDESDTDTPSTHAPAGARKK